MREETLKKKKEVIDEIKSNIEKAKSIVLVDYIGLNVSDLTELRADYRKNGVVYKVYKNNFMKFAFEEMGLNEMVENLQGPNALAFSMDDVISAAKISNEFAKKNEKFKIKAGTLEGKYMDKAGILDLAETPSMEVLLSKFMGSIQSPISALVRTFAAVSENKNDGSKQAEEVKEVETKEAEALVEETVAEVNEAEEVQEVKEVETTEEN